MSVCISRVLFSLGMFLISMWLLVSSVIRIWFSILVWLMKVWLMVLWMVLMCLIRWVLVVVGSLGILVIVGILFGVVSGCVCVGWRNCVVEGV